LIKLIKSTGFKKFQLLEFSVIYFGQTQWKIKVLKKANSKKMKLVNALIISAESQQMIC
jgi:hypothetical protein